MEAMYERPLVNMKVERRSTFTLRVTFHTLSLLLFARVKFTCDARKSYATVEIHLCRLFPVPSRDFVRAGGRTGVH